MEWHHTRTLAARFFGNHEFWEVYRACRRVVRVGVIVRVAITAFARVRTFTRRPILLQRLTDHRLRWVVGLRSAVRAGHAPCTRGARLSYGTARIADLLAVIARVTVAILPARARRSGGAQLRCGLACALDWWRARGLGRHANAAIIA